ncbi:hypothetical protein [Streptomyces sp. CC77]|uniref:hypothetical protein n=1 Tax=Streptomyces sp. CC77 TaxID=1906739 RepID=UPI0008DD73A5|nr:hypothetical protein [Streptomyces sp. CC77]OII67108.1 hypothetical protein BJP39_26055 [Streptomyces sp. CC77]
MDIESDQLVFDYLSRVGDLAQQRQLPAKQRMNLVASLRTEIARRREDGADTPASVRRVLAGLGTPEAVVTAVASGALAVPEQRTSSTPRPAAETAGAADARGARPEPDWWRVDAGAPGAAPDPAAATALFAAGPVPGFLGGVEIPDLLEPPKKDEDDTEDTAADPAGKADRRRALLRRLALLRRRPARAGDAPAEAPAEEPAPPAKLRARLRNPLLLVAAALLVAGVAFGSWLALGGGWVLAYASGKLSRAQAKWAVFGLPGVAVAAGGLWLWGRLTGRWGDPVPAGGTGLTDAMTATWPWVVRAAALTSALYLVWRARRA